MEQFLRIQRMLCLAVLFGVAVACGYVSHVSVSSVMAADRSNRWPAVRDAYLEAHQTCEACGGKENLRVHHVEPVGIAPDRELDPTNLITLCDGHHCHLMVGHLGDWRAWNPTVRQDAAAMLERIKTRPYTREEAKKFQHQFQTAL